MITSINEFKHILESTKETMTFWHGGNLDGNYYDGVTHKAGNWEHGPGLYMTTQYDVVQKYAKGSRKLYTVTVEKGIDINDVYLPLDVVTEFTSEHVIKNKRKDVTEAIHRREKDNTINANTFLNIIINNNAIKNTDTNIFRQFFVRNGIDYSIVDNAFGWGEKMMVLFNMRKIVNVNRFKSGDRLDDWNFPRDFQTTEMNESAGRKEYLKWKRNNVSYRGMRDRYEEGNGGMAILGQGLYTAALSNKEMAKKYGTVYYVVNGRPKNPKVFNTLTDWETWFGNTLVWDFCKSNGIQQLDKRYFYANTSIVAEMEKRGYDGVEIRGREYVNYSPENVLYFQNDHQLEDYYNRVIMYKES